MTVAVIGAGIAGVSTAWHLQQSGVANVLYERAERIGGHTETHAVESDAGQTSVDTGFIVFNEHNYPNFSRWLNELSVPSRVTSMSFAVSDAVLDIEYGTASRSGLIAHPRQLARPRYWRMWRDVLRFYRELREGPVPDVTLRDYLRTGGFSASFTEAHMIPMCCALWSQDSPHALDISLRHVIEFMRNHRMLEIAERPEWRVVAGGSSTYLEAFEKRYTGTICCGSRDLRVHRLPGHVIVESNGHAPLSSAMRGLTVRLARRLNQLWQRSGRVATIARALHGSCRAHEL